MQQRTADARALVDRIDEQQIELCGLSGMIDAPDADDHVANLRDEHIACRDVLLADDELCGSTPHERRVVAPNGF